MAITLQYGNIADALNLAKKAGQNDADQQNFRNFTQFADLTQQAQNSVDRRNASQIQNALASDQLQQQYSLAQDRLQSENQHNAAQLAMAGERNKATDNFHEQELGVRKEAVANTKDYRDTRSDQFQQQQDRLGQNDQLKQDAISALPPDQQAAVQATGRLPYGTQTPDQSDDRRANVLLRQLEFAQRQLKDASFDPNDLKQLGLQGSQKTPGAIAGKEQTFSQATQMAAAAQAELQQINTRRQQSQQPQSAVQAGTQNLNSAAVLKGAQATGQPQAPQAPPSGPGSQTMPVHVSSAQDYAQLPSGSYYVDPTGQTRQKL